MSTARDLSGTRRLVRSSWLTERRVAYGVLALCAVLAVVQHFWFMSANSATIDELVHVESGYRYWQCGDYGVSPENPPLPKLVAAFPVRHWQLGGFAGPCGSQVTPSRGPDYVVAIAWLLSPIEPNLLWQARAAMVVFVLALVVITFFSARSFFGLRAAALAAILLTFEPTLIAHSSLATIDTASAVCVLASLWAAYEVAVKPSFVRALVLGIAVGLALDSKFLNMPLPLMALAIILLPEVKREFSWHKSLYRFGLWCGAGAVSWAVIWAAYRFRYSALPHAAKPSYDYTQIFSSADLANTFWPKLCSFLANHRLLPEAYIAGLATLKSFDASPAYLLGNVYPEGVWYYYPVAILIKATIPVLVLAFIALVSPQVWKRNRLAMLTLVLGIVASMAPAMAGRVNMGVRHVLPLFPVLVLLAAAACTMLGRSRKLALLAGVLVVFHVLSSLRSVPLQLSYANELAGGPTHLYKYLDDSNLDWGQSDEAIDTYVRSHPGPCAIGWFAPHRSNPPCVALPAFMTDLLLSRGNLAPLPDNFTGKIILQPSAVVWTDGYLPFLQRKPDETFANGSVLVYQGTFDLRALAAVRRMDLGLLMMYFLHDPQRAVSQFAAAEASVPAMNRPMYEAFYGSALLQLKRPAEAKLHFERVLRLTNNHPGFRAERDQAMKALKGL